MSWLPWLAWALAGTHTDGTVTVEDEVFTTEVRTQTWTDDGWTRVALDSYAGNPPLVLLVELASGKTYAVDERRQVVAPLRRSPAPGAAMQAVELGLKGRRMRAATEPFQPLPAQPGRSPLLDDQATVVGHVAKGGRGAATLWLQPGLPATMSDFADRRPGLPPSIDAALRALPGYPVQHRFTATGRHGKVVTTTVLNAVSHFDEPPVALRPPDGFQPVDWMELYLGLDRTEIEAEAERARASHGLDTPYEPTPAQPLPPPLPSGWSCRPSKQVCWEEWFGHDADPGVSVMSCGRKGLRKGPCPREGVETVCAMAGGLMQTYHYDADALCDEVFETTYRP